MVDQNLLKDINKHLNNLILLHLNLNFLGAVFGMVFGLEIIDPLLDSATKKLSFVSIWFSFAFALFLLNREHKRKTFDTIQNCSWWEAIILILTGSYT